MQRPLVGALTAALVAAAALTGIAANPATATGQDGTGTTSAQQQQKQQSQKARQAKAAPNFAGTVALSNCSGSVVRVPQSQPTDPALVLTNGHCLESGMPGAGEVIVNRASSRTFTLLNASAGNAGTLRATKIAYGTMTDTDAAIYQLNTTYQAIESQYKIKALDIPAAHPTAGRAVTVVSGYWKRTYSCAIDGFVHQLKEASWTWKDSIRYTSACHVIGGTSGSPLVDDATNQVVGVNNTTSESGQRCTMNNPCEVDENGQVTVRRGIGYAQQVHWFVDCIKTGNQIDLNLPGCKLPRP